MKLITVIFSLLFVLCSNALVFAVLYTDTTVDLHDGSGGGTNFSSFTHLDIDEVEVTHTATDISFAITLVGDIAVNNWGKYLISFDTIAAGDTSGNGWGRPISMSSGMDYWIGSWVDGGGGAELYSWDGTAWNSSTAPGLATTSNSATLTVPLADLGLSSGDTFQFDVYSSSGGGGDGAVDALSHGSPTITDWGNSFNTTSPLSYTISAVPEPSAFLFGSLVCGVLGLTRARKNRRS